MRFLLSGLIVLFFSVVLASPATKCHLEGPESLQNWRLAKITAHLFDEQGQPLVQLSLSWKLFYGEEDLSGELLHSQTQGESHTNCFRPKKEGAYQIRVFLGQETTPLATQVIQATPHQGYLQELATGSECEQELGFIDWVEDLELARQLALKQKKLIFLAYYVGCDTSAGVSRELFKNPKFVKQSESFVCVPVILDGRGDSTGQFYQVPTGLCTVLLNSEGMYLGTHFRPEPEEFDKILPQAIKQNEDLLKESKKRRKFINRLEESQKLHPLLELARFYQEGKAFQTAIPLYEDALYLLEEFKDASLNTYVIETLLYLYLSLNRAEEIVLLAESVEEKTPYMLFSLGAAYTLKSEKPGDLHAKEALHYFNKLKESGNNPILSEPAQKFLQKLQQ